MRRFAARSVLVVVIGLAPELSGDCNPDDGVEECEGNLHDGIDNDCNGLTDLEDPGCMGFWVPGDCNTDGTVAISDAICLFSYLFLGEPEELPCQDTTEFRSSPLTEYLDWNGNDQIEIGDGIATLQWLFADGFGHHMGPDCNFAWHCGTYCVRE